MSKFKYALCAAALSATLSANAATDGIVTFNGELVAETCTVVDESKSIEVQLPKVAVQKLAAYGEQAGSTSFEIKVKDCPAGVAQVGAHFEALNSSGADPETGNLVNASTQTDKAKMVQVRLYNYDDGSQVKVGDTGHLQNIDSNHEATMVYAGGYFAVGATTPGDVYAQVQYVLAYP